VLKKCPARDEGKAPTSPGKGDAGGNTEFLVPTRLAQHAPACHLRFGSWAVPGFTGELVRLEGEDEGQTPTSSA